MAGLHATGDRGAIRFAHLSDMHVEPDLPGSTPRHSQQGLISALKSVDEMSPAPDFIITGGDHIMDALERPTPDVHRQWDLYRETMREHCKFEVRPVVGNHDVFGWMTEQVPPETPGYGKSLACQMLGLTKPYYSFDVGNWHFVILDNTQPCQRGYFGGLDGSQFQWLQKDLAATPRDKHIVVVSHIPIVSVCAQHFFAPEQRVDFWKIYDVFVHHDSRELVELLAKHKVKLCIASHIHMLDRIEFRGITFICDGSVSGDWWRGPFRGFPEGYGIFDLLPDGTFHYEYQPYGWNAKATQLAPVL
jgi:3',5'-cyclic AMP phosphodiesterase CpdA